MVEAIKGSSELLMDVDRFSRKAVDRESVEVVTQNRFSNTIKFSELATGTPGLIVGLLKTQISR